MIDKSWVKRDATILAERRAKAAADAKRLKTFQDFIPLLCRRCAKSPPENGFKECWKCRRKLMEYARRKRERLREKGAEK